MQSQIESIGIPWVEKTDHLTTYGRFWLTRQVTWGSDVCIIYHILAKDGQSPWFFHQINQLGKTQFAVESSEVLPKLDHSKELLLFRICSELINNTLKHSAAQRAMILFRVQRRILYLKYSDNGKGFDYKPESIEKGKSGLYNIMRRVESMEGN